jgi:predicted flap endonuclease-1-like 5' DNA nuclease
MVWFTEFDEKSISDGAEKAFQTPIGAMSPLWFAYASAAGAGLTMWWMSQMMKPLNLEAMPKSFFPDFEGFPDMTKGFGELNFPNPMVEMLAAIQPEPVSAPQTPDADAAPVRAAIEPVTEAADAAVEMMTKSAEAAAETVQAAADDLTQLVGIGPTLAGKLGDLGVTTFADIAAWTDEDIARFDKELKLMGRVGRDNWIDQARQLAEASA